VPVPPRNAVAIASDTPSRSAPYALWVAAPLGAQDLLVRSDPEHYFRPPYVGHRGWVGVTLDNEPEWHAVERIVADGYAEIATKKRAR